MYLGGVTSKSPELRELLRRRAATAARECGAEASLYKSRETFVLAYGRDYVSAPFNPHERTQLQELLRKHREFWRRGFAYNHCFTNAQELLAFDTAGTLVYVEGFVWGYADKLPPVQHGWLSLHRKVVNAQSFLGQIHDCDDQQHHC